MVVGIVEINSAWYGEVSQFYMSERPQEVCAKYWWRNILYINNLFGRDKMVNIQDNNLLISNWLIKKNNN